MKNSHADHLQFDLFDLDKDAHIDYHELKVAMKALGFDLPKPEIISILQQHGVPLDSIATAANPHPQPPRRAKQTFQYTGPSRLLLPLDAFQRLMAARILARDPRDEVNRAFDLFDVEGKGMIGVDELRRVARELGEGLGDDELAAMIEEFDLDGDGQITRDEFIDICLS